MTERPAPLAAAAKAPAATVQFIPGIARLDPKAKCLAIGHLAVVWRSFSHRVVVAADVPHLAAREPIASLIIRTTGPGAVTMGV